MGYGSLDGCPYKCTYLPRISTHRIPQPPDVKDYYAGLTFNFFQIFSNLLRELIFNDVTRINRYDRLILVWRRGR